MDTPYPIRRSAADGSRLARDFTAQPSGESQDPGNGGLSWPIEQRRQSISEHSLTEYSQVNRDPGYIAFPSVVKPPGERQPVPSNSAKIPSGSGCFVPKKACGLFDPSFLAAGCRALVPIRWMRIRAEHASRFDEPYRERADCTSSPRPQSR